MAQFTNYAGAPYKVDKTIRDYIDELEGQLKESQGISGIEVRWAAGQRVDRPEDLTAETEKKVVLFDYGTTNTVTRPRNRYELYRPGNTSFITFEKMPYALEAPAGAICATFNRANIAEISYLTGWFLIPLCNLSRKTDAEAMLKVVVEHSIFFDIEQFKTAEEKKQKAVRNNFLKHMKKATERDKVTAEAQLTSINQQLSVNQSQGIELLRQQRRAGEQIKFAEQAAESDLSQFTKAIDELLENKHFDRIGYNEKSSELELYTELLYLYSPNRQERAPLGRFLIRISTTNWSIRFINTTNARAGKQHPHVENDGSPCLGSLSTEIQRLAASMDLVPLAETLIVYLETYNVEDSNARYASYWLKKTDPDVQYLQKDGTTYLTTKQIEEAQNEQKKQSKKRGKASKKTISGDEVEAGSTIQAAVPEPAAVRAGS